jgi:hypothetical protein
VNYEIHLHLISTPIFIIIMQSVRVPGPLLTAAADTAFTITATRVFITGTVMNVAGGDHITTGSPSPLLLLHNILHLYVCHIFQNSIIIIQLFQFSLIPVREHQAEHLFWLSIVLLFTLTFSLFLLFHFLLH